MTLAGSVLRAKTHNGNPPRSPAGEVFSFIAVKPPLGGIPGKYTYRSFLNNPTYPYLTAPPTADGLILQEADLRLEAPTSTTLRGTISWPGRSLDIQGRVGTIEGFPSSFWITGTGGGWERRYQGFLTRHWAEGLNQVLALVGSVINVLPPPGGYAAPFIAVKRQ
jgi:hypothetical protein